MPSAGGEVEARLWVSRAKKRDPKKWADGGLVRIPRLPTHLPGVLPPLDKAGVQGRCAFLKPCTLANLLLLAFSSQETRP